MSGVQQRVLSLVPLNVQKAINLTTNPDMNTGALSTWSPKRIGR